MCSVSNRSVWFGRFPGWFPHPGDVPRAAGFAGVWEQLCLLVSRSSGRGAYELHLVVPPVCVDGYGSLGKERRDLLVISAKKTEFPMLLALLGGPER